MINPLELIVTQKFKINFGKDSLMHYSFQYYMLPLLYILAFYCLINKISLIYLLTYVFVGIPLLDEIIQTDMRNPSKEEAKKLGNEERFKLPLYLNVFLDWMYTFYTLKLLITTDISIFNQVLMVFACGMFGGTNINVAHELCHKIESGVYLDYYIGQITMSKALYMYFIPEHNYGHHRNVATLHDPATSKKGQKLYNFYIQTLVGTFISAWEIEGERLLKFNKDIKSVYHYKNKFFWYMANNIVLPFLVFKWGGVSAMIYFIIIAFLSVIFLETINYIEHYGLLRNKQEDGSYEKVTHHHSWNAPHRISNYLLFKLQRHSDHHENSTKPYQILLSDESSPTLPNGYAMMVLLALIPNFYFEIMDRCLESYKKPELKEKYSGEIQKLVQQFLERLILVFLGLNVLAQFL